MDYNIAEAIDGIKESADKLNTLFYAIKDKLPKKEKHVSIEEIRKIKDDIHNRMGGVLKGMYYFLNRCTDLREDIKKRLVDRYFKDADERRIKILNSEVNYYFWEDTSDMKRAMNGVNMIRYGLDSYFNEISKFCKAIHNEKEMKKLVDSIMNKKLKDTE